jgi:CRISPR-associated protein Csd1
MILGALANYYDTLAADPQTRTPPIGYSYENISYVLVLKSDGTPVRVEPWLDTSGKKPRPKKEIVPQTERTSGIKAKFLWDNPSYVFGRSSKSKRSGDEHGAFKELHKRLLSGNGDPALQAVLSFLHSWQPEGLEHLRGTATILEEDNANIVFRLDGERGFVHEREAAKRIWDGEFGKDNAAPGTCLLSGEETLIANLHPVIKGVRNAQTRGACIVSFNANAFTSFGKESGANAPVAAEKVYAYTLALNHLLTGERQRVQIADATTVFWAEAPSNEIANEAEAMFGCVLSDSARDAGENANVMALLRKIAEGRPLAELDPRLASEDTKFYVLGLSPNAARIAIRFWQANSFAHFANNMRQHYLDLRIEPVPWRTPPSAWRLLLQTAPQRKSENIPAILAGAAMRAILTGQTYPQTLFGQILTRIRADHDVNGLRAAILKACLVRRERQSRGTQQKDGYLVSLDRNEPNEAYRLGRLFAVLEAAQRAALGNINATIRDRFYGSASATPAAVFPMLLRNSKNHLANLRRGRAATWVKDARKTGWWLDKEMASILEGFGPGFPRAFAIEDQGRFAIGYYHQRFTKTADAPPEVQATAENAQDDNDERIEL